MADIPTYAAGLVETGIVRAWSSDGFVGSVATSAGTRSIPMATVDTFSAGDQVYVVPLPGGRMVAIPSYVLTNRGDPFNCSRS